MKRILVCVGIISVVAAHSCSGPTEPDPYDFRYPLAVGNQWVYDYNVTAVFGEDSVQQRESGLMGVIVSDTTTFFPGALQYTLTEFFGQFPGDSSITEPQFGSPGGGIYVNMKNGLYHVQTVSLGGWNVAPKRSADSCIVRIGSLEFSSVSDMIASLGAGLISPPLSASGEGSILRLSLPYPLELGQSWTYNDSAFGGVTVIKKSVADTTRTLKMNDVEIECYMVGWEYSGSISDIEITDCISDKGLISREIVFKDIAETSYIEPYGTGEFYDLHLTYDLSEYQLTD
ncbi:MAG: hypothetical protein GF341_05230 [candidate division Zixibacteria bacterium]|nr:hypothetical protein [candidate division Zixibacteria bacterium]